MFIKFIFILMILIFSCCNSINNLKNPNKFNFYTERIHWFNYYQIVKIEKIKENFLKEFCKKHSIPFIMVHKDDFYIYLKIPENKLKILQNQFADLTTIKDFPFIWWDSDLKNRKNSFLRNMINGYKDYEAVLQILNYLKSKYPDYIKIQELGKSYKNKSIFLIHLTNHKNSHPYKIPIYFNAAHHGNEILTIEYILDMIFLLLGENYIDLPESLKNFQGNLLIQIPEEIRNQILNSLDIFIIPIVNPDGLENFWYKSIIEGRKNARKVDLNRNYPFNWKSSSFNASSSEIESYNYRGIYGSSEKEIQYIINFLKQNPCSFGISYHTYAKKVLVPYTIDFVWNPIPDRAYYFAKKLLNDSYSFRREPYLLTRKLYSVDGTDQDWIYNEIGCIAYIVEGSMNTPIFPIAKYSIVGIRNIWYNLLNIAMKENRIEIEFYYNNQFVKPEIEILNYKFFEKEQFYFYHNRWIFYLGPIKELIIKTKFHQIEKIFHFYCISSICREKIYLTKD